jgi:hypothetical protein
MDPGQLHSAAQITSAMCSCLIHLLSLNCYSRVSLSVTPHVQDFNLWWSPILTPLCETLCLVPMDQDENVWLQVVSHYDADHTIHEPRDSTVFICYRCAQNICQLSLHIWPLHQHQSHRLFYLCINTGPTLSYLPLHQHRSHTVLPTSECGCSDTLCSSPSSCCTSWSHICYCTLPLMYIFIEISPTYLCLCVMDIWHINCN